LPRPDGDLRAYPVPQVEIDPSNLTAE